MSSRNYPRGFLVFAAIMLAAIFPRYANSQGWFETDAPSSMWASIAASTDASKMVAGSVDGVIFVSTNSGFSWRPMTNTPPGTWWSVATSGDGNTILGASSTGLLCLTTNAGKDWHNTSAPLQFWFTVAMTPDARMLVAASQWDMNPGEYGGIYISTNFGSSWNLTSAPLGQWRSVACSEAATTLIAACLQDTNSNPCPLYYTTNSGLTWVSNNMPVSNWECVDLSPDGSRLIAGDNSGRIYVSTNSGMSWISNSLPNYISSVKSSASGDRLFALEFGGLVYASTNFGVSWTAINHSWQSWSSIVTSGDGSKQVVASFGGGIQTTIPDLKIVASGTNITVSWSARTISAGFSLQESSQPSAINWNPVGLPVYDDGTNKVVGLSLLSGSKYFRLVHP